VQVSKKFLRKKQVAARYGDICDRTVDRMVADGRLPAPHYRGGGRIPFFSEEELNESDRIAAARSRASQKNDHHAGQAK
jgi:predicted DNA-binding transcriptional regulator AlpA